MEGSLGWDEWVGALRRRAGFQPSPPRKMLDGLRMVAEDDAAAAASPRLRAPTPVVDRTGDGLGTLRRAMRASPQPSAPPKPGASGMEALPAAPPDRFDVADIELRAHGRRESLLHSGSDFGDFRGFINLGMLCLFVSSFRIALENIADYGLLADITPFLHCLYPLPVTPNRLIFLSLIGYVLTAVAIEKAAAALAVHAPEAGVQGGGKDEFRRVAAELALDGAHWVNIMCALVVPCGLVTYYQTPVAGAFLVVFESVIVWMKLISYVAVNQHYRWRLGSAHNAGAGAAAAAAGGVAVANDSGAGSGRVSADSVATESDVDGEHHGPHRRRRSHHGHHLSRADSVSGPPVRYPDNVTVGDIFFFMVVPTLCYELKFPRTPRIRKRFAARRLAEVVILLVTVIFLIQQWMIPLIAVTLELGDEVSVTYMFFRVLKMALPNNLIWLILFYLYFHSWMNLFAELLRFGDRQFYRDWWNAHTVWYFWRNWNIPVHKWMQRHVYRPLRALGASRLVAVTVVFAVSAILHEVVVDIPLGVFKGYAFAGMFIYVPLASLTDLLYKYTKSKMWGNIVVWCSLVLGQPAGILLYARGISSIAGQRDDNVSHTEL